MKFMSKFKSRDTDMLLLLYLILAVILAAEGHSSLKFTLTPQDTISVPQMNVTFECGVFASERVMTTGRVTVQWKRSVDKAASHNFLFVLKHGDSHAKLHYSDRMYLKSRGNEYSLQIPSVNKKDEGYYTCEAVVSDDAGNMLETITSGASLHVIEKHDNKNPLWSRMDVESYTHATSHLPCDVTEITRGRGDNSRTIVWLDEEMNTLAHGDNVVTKDTRMSINEPKAGWLEIKHTMTEDAQKYYCVLASVTPPVWQEVNLRVTGCLPPYDDLGTGTRNENVERCSGVTPQFNISHAAAERWCNRSHADFAMPNSEHEGDVLKSATLDVFWEYVNPWVGLYDIGDQEYRKCLEKREIDNQQQCDGGWTFFKWGKFCHWNWTTGNDVSGNHQATTALPV